MSKDKKINDLLTDFPENSGILELAESAHFDGILLHNCLREMLEATGEDVEQLRDVWFATAEAFIEEINLLGVNGEDVSALLKQATSCDVPPLPRPDRYEARLGLEPELKNLVFEQLQAGRDFFLGAKETLAAIEQARNVLNAPFPQEHDVKDSWTSELVLEETVLAETINFMSIGGWCTQDLIKKITLPLRPEKTLVRHKGIGPKNELR